MTYTTPLRTFSKKDQFEFAKLSGDYNPIHVDELAARKTSSGNLVVHGINIVLWALEYFTSIKPQKDKIASISTKFIKISNINELLRIETTFNNNGAEIHIYCGIEKRVQLSVSYGSYIADAGIIKNNNLAIFDSLKIPLKQNQNEIYKLEGKLKIEKHDKKIAQLYPCLIEEIGIHRIVGLFHTTYLVGMVSPGLHSIFASLQAFFTNNYEANYCSYFKIDKSDTRFNLVSMSLFGNGIIAKINSIIRPEPVIQKSISHLEDLCSPVDFTHLTSLIVGGTRGIGAVCAKLIALGGGQVTITYFKGKDDADQIVDEINSFTGKSNCKAIHMDANDIETYKSNIKHLGINSLLYFATSSITLGTNKFNDELYQRHHKIHVKGFVDILEILSKINENEVKVFYPSTIFIDDVPYGMLEYVLAKQNAEMVCDYYSKNIKNIAVNYARLPRLRTDQTSGLTNSEFPDTAEVMMNVLKNIFVLD